MKMNPGFGGTNCLPGHLLTGLLTGTSILSPTGLPLRLPVHPFAGSLSGSLSGVFAGLLAGLFSCLSLAACSDDLPVEEGISSLPKGLVEVTLPLTLEEAADGYDLDSRKAQTRSDGSKKAVDAQLLPSAGTRAADDPLKTAKPDKVYEFHLVQLKPDGTVLTDAGTNYNGGTPIELGKKVTLLLKPSDNCQLIVYARGGVSSESSAAGGSLNSGTWTTFKVPAARINGITDEAGMKNMPYYLHLKQVKVIAGAGTGEGIVQSVTGEDVRLRLRRLAARFNVTWTYNVSGYTLQEVTLQDIPLNYIAIPSTTKTTYPSIVDQYTTVKVPDPAAGTFSCWMPRNVRGTVNITSQTRRGKVNAPAGSGYLRFVATKNDNPKKKLIYRIYLGGNVTNDFNILDNTNYNYALTFTHTDENIWKEDDRVEYLNGSLSASENNNSPVPTANCFMVEPGGSFNFDPFLYRQAGKDIENTTLKGWANGTRGGIQSVKLVWQTRENGDVGDPVIGIVNNSSDHSNIVEVKRTDGSSIETTPAKAPGECRVYCRVAANTTGGNGLIAACDASGKILWSWHVWVTDYNPSPHGDATVLDPASRRKQKYTYRADINQLPMMDRNLGALAGYVEVPTGDDSELEKSKANGLHYQWGRKDPFPGSYTTKTINSVTIPDKATVPTEGLLNLYGPDGYTFIPRSITGSKATIEQSCMNPTNVYGRPWYAMETQYWGSVSAKENKTIYDPCPQGWRVTEGKNFYSLFSASNYSGGDATTTNSSLRTKNSDYVKDGGALLYYDTQGGITYFRMTGYQEYPYQFNYIGKMLNIWCRDHINFDGNWWSTTFDINRGGLGNHSVSNVSRQWNPTDAHNIRCIQEEK